MAQNEPAALPDHILRAIRGETTQEEKETAYKQSLNKCAHDRGCADVYRLRSWQVVV